MGTGSLFFLGVAVVSIGAVLHVTANLSVRVVKMSLKLKSGEQTPPP